jgi:hypothetical protein
MHCRWIDTTMTLRHNMDVIDHPDIRHGSNNDRIDDINTIRWS